MKVEYEATFTNVNKDEIRKILKEKGAVLLREEFIQKRKTFYQPTHINKDDGFMRVRDEGDKVTMTLKIFKGEGIESQKESEIVVGDFEEACQLVENLGMKQKAFQETKRELWVLDEVEIMIDEWPLLEPFVEVEGGTESKVKSVSEKLGFDWNGAIFNGIAVQYAKKYNISEDRINNHSPIIIFDMDNPFID